MAEIAVPRAGLWRPACDDVAWIQQVIIGLARERRVSPLEILKTQPAFLAAISFNTEWAREQFPACMVTAKIAEAERLQALLEGGYR